MYTQLDKKFLPSLASFSPEIRKKLGDVACQHCTELLEPYCNARAWLCICFVTTLYCIFQVFKAMRIQIAVLHDMKSFRKNHLPLQR
jgi:hypothetical protein